MADIHSLQYEWRNFSANRGKAHRAVSDQADQLRAQALELEEKARRIEREHTEEWKVKKVQLKEAFDEAVKDELRTGRSAQEVLRELGSNNTVWIYKLRAEVMAELESSGKKASTPALKIVPNHEDEDTPSEEIESLPDPDIEGVEWQHHDHEGVHRWLISKDRQYIKRYGVEGTPYEGKYFIADTDNNFVSGDKKLYENTPKSDLLTRANMLIDLLEGNFQGRIKLSPNKWKS